MATGAKGIPLLYYLRDGFFDTQATRVAKAKELAIAAGKMAWLDEEVKT